VQNQKMSVRFFLSLIFLSILTSCGNKSDSKLNKIPEECSEVITAAERYWEIFNEVQDYPQKGYEFSKEIKNIPIPSGMESVQNVLTYLVEDEHDCFINPSSYYFCHPIDKERRDFIKSMDYLPAVYLPHDLIECAPFLESMYLQNQQ
jgi:hypothetical protein